MKRPILTLREAERLVEKHGSPLYVYRKDLILGAYNALARALRYKEVKIFFACKANTNHEVLKLLLKAGANIEAVSPGEIEAALKAGFAPEKISFTCSNIARDELHAVMNKGVRVHLDSLNQIAWWGEKRPNADISIRINRGFGAGSHSHVITGGDESKFGIHFSHIDEAKRRAEKHGLRIVGLHQHIGSNILDPRAFLSATKLLFQSAHAFPDLEYLDFGGGFGIPYRPSDMPLDIKTLGSEMTNLFRAFSKERGKEFEFSVEPGRYLVAAGSALLAHVVDTKTTPAHTFVGVNTGFNHLIRAAMYGSYHHIFNLSNPRGKTVQTTVAGNLCESGDVFCKDRPIPECRIGDILLFADAGAYGFTMSSDYNLRPKPKEILV